MKLPNSQLTSFTAKSLNVLYLENTAGAYYLIKTYYSNLRLYFKPTLNLVKEDTSWFNSLVTHNLEISPNSNLTKFKKGYDDEGREILISVTEETTNTPDTVKLGYNLRTLDVNFLRKEKIYAKLKYSRSPQYDIVSGGIAAIFSGYLGFLICEKFGLELLDSGDFYTAFMYGVFLVFACRPLVRVVNGLTKDKNYTPTYNILSPQPLIQFYTNLIKLVFKFFKVK